MFTERGKTVSLIVLGLIFLIMLHHAFIHDGIWYQVSDLQTAIWSLFKSHEGIALLLLIVLFGFLIHDYTVKKKKKK